MAMQCQYKLGSVATQLGSNVWVGTTLCFSLILAVCLGPARRKGLRSQELPAAGVARRQDLPAAPEKGHAPRADAWRLRQQRETARNLEKAGPTQTELWPHPRPCKSWPRPMSGTHARKRALPGHHVRGGAQPLSTPARRRDGVSGR